MNDQNQNKNCGTDLETCKQYRFGRNDDFVVTITRNSKESCYIMRLYEKNWTYLGSVRMEEQVNETSDWKSMSYLFYAGYIYGRRNLKSYIAKQVTQLIENA